MDVAIRISYELGRVLKCSFYVSADTRKGILSIVLVRPDIVEVFVTDTIVSELCVGLRLATFITPVDATCDVTGATPW